MGGWRGNFRDGVGDPLAHPSAPAGGSGLGSSRMPSDPHAADAAHAELVPHPDSPAARFWDWTGLSQLDTVQRAQSVLDAIDIAQRLAPGAILEATGEELYAMLKGLIPGLLMCLALVAATTALGGAAGAAIGALAAGAGAVPGAAVGAAFGFDAGLAILEFLGIAFMADAIASSLIESVKMASRAVVEAWHAVDDPRTRWYHVDHAGRTLANALGVLMRGVLQGVIAFLLAKGAEAAATRVPELAAKLRQSKFGDGLATWVERNWASLLKNKKLQPKQETVPGSGGSAKGSGGGGEAPASNPEPKSEGPAAPKPEPEPKPAEAKPAEKPSEKPTGKAATAAERAAILKEMNDVAGTADVTTPHNGLQLWSGGGMDGAGGVALKTAKASGGKTLEMTEAGEKLGALQEKLGPWQDLTDAEKAQSGEAWKTASERICENASGDVNVTVDPSKVRQDGIVFDELKALGDNGKVTNVTLTDTSGNVISSGSAADASTALRAIIP
jgi:hypothetical protein